MEAANFRLNIGIYLSIRTTSYLGRLYIMQVFIS